MMHIEMGVPTKWNWIENQCLMWGFYNSARAALKVDIALRQTYGETRTTEWICWFNCKGHREYFEYKASKEEMKKVIFSTLFCIGCERTRECNACGYGRIHGAVKMSECEACEFSMKHGACNLYGSLFADFVEIFSKESDITKKEAQI